MLESVLKEMEAYAAREHVPIINEGGRRALIQVIEAARPERVLEIGTAIGYSALLFLAHGARNTQVVTLELNEERAATARLYWARAGNFLGLSTSQSGAHFCPPLKGVSECQWHSDVDRAESAVEGCSRGSKPLPQERIKLLVGDAGKILETLEPPAGGFDFVFIDAAKGQYPDYLRKVLPLLAPRACIAADNVLFRGYVLGSEKPPRRYKTIVKRLREYLELAGALESEGFKTKILEKGDGLSLIYRGMDLEGVE